MNFKTIAFYLPQYYPTPENDNWYGKGFTEWTNVGNAKPQFKGHYQPRVPADLGYYDLRIPDVREAQAELAKEAGISAFCYYHYWFGNGKQMLEMPLNEVVRSGKPDFPFCLAWANHTWYKKMWDPNESLLKKNILIKQEYNGEKEIDEHFYSLLSKFKDKRYYKLNGKLLFVLYKVENIPYLDLLIERWNKLALDNKLPGFYFVAYADDIDKITKENYKKCDASILSLKTEPGSFGHNAKFRWYTRVIVNLASNILKRPLYVFPYSKVIKMLVNPIFKENRIYPAVIPNWDSTPRRGSGGLVFHNSNPELFKKYVIELLNLVKSKDPNDRLIFIKSWNEWGEGNYLEPDLKFGKEYIKALKTALDQNY